MPHIHFCAVWLRLWMGWQCHTIVRTLHRRLGERTQEIVDSMRKEYAELFTAEALTVIDQWEEHDFNVALYPEEMQEACERAGQSGQP